MRTKGIAIHSHDTYLAIRSRTPFDAGNLSGDYSRGTGILPDIWARHFRERYAHITYAIYSYHTPLAWYDDELGWTYPDVKYSISTTNHQRAVSTALHGKRSYHYDYAARELVIDSEDSPVGDLLTAPLPALRRAAEIFGTRIDTDALSLIGQYA